MQTIPEELRRRWAEKDRQPVAPEIAKIDLVDYAPGVPELDSLEEIDSSALPVNEPPAKLHAVKSTAASSPLIRPMKLHGVKSAGFGSVSIAQYEQPKFS